jgi:DNA polymerase-1
LAFARAERQGIRVDLEYVERKKREMTKQITRAEDKFRASKLCKHWNHTVKNVPNIHSDAQLRTFLYKVKKLEPVKTTESGLGSTDEESLLALKIPELNDLIKIRKLKKIRDTYLDAFDREQVNGYIHTSFNLHLPTTFRSSSDRPNFQNIPIRDKESMQLTRRALFPRPGHQLLCMDFSGLEVCIAACYNKDPNLIKYIEDPKSDMHADMAEQIFMIDDFNKSLPEHYHLRQAAKNGFVFPEFYGDYYKNCAEYMAGKWGELGDSRWKRGQGVPLPTGTLSDHLIGKGITSMEKFTEHIREIEQDFWSNRFPVYDKWKQKWWEQYQKRGFIEMKTGFTCSGVMRRNDVINYPVQGSAFHCLLWSFNRLDDVMVKDKWDTRLIGQIHDEVVFDVHPDELEMVMETAKQITTRDLPKAWPWIIVPLNVDAELCDVDASWAEKKAVEYA